MCYAITIYHSRANFNARESRYKRRRPSDGNGAREKFFALIRFSHEHVKTAPPVVKKKGGRRGGRELEIRLLCEHIPRYYRKIWNSYPRPGGECEYSTRLHRERFSFAWIRVPLIRRRSVDIMSLPIVTNPGHRRDRWKSTLEMEPSQITPVASDIPRGSGLYSSRPKFVNHANRWNIERNRV